MNTMTIRGKIILVAFALTVLPLAFALSTDEQAIRDLENQQQEAWNKHDAKAYASLFSKDGDCVNVAGWWWKGRAEIEKKLTAAYAFLWRDSVLTIADVDVNFPAPDLAIAHVRWSMTGARTPENFDFAKPQQGIQTQVLKKREGKWSIVAFQETNALPEKFLPPPPGSTPQPSITPNKH